MKLFCYAKVSQPLKKFPKVIQPFLKAVSNNSVFKFNFSPDGFADVINQIKMKDDSLK